MWKQIAKSGISYLHTMRTLNNKSSLIEDSWKGILKKSYISTKVALDFCQHYKCLEKKEKQVFLNYIAVEYNFEHENAMKVANSFLMLENRALEHKLNAAEKLKCALHPKYMQAFSTISTLDAGIKFLVDLRSNVLDLILQTNSEDYAFFSLKALNNHLKDMLAFCFNVGFLALERITWDSSCHILQKISEYEAVHPVRNWTDLKQRVGPYRRCYVFIHSCMPKEPVVVLHTALTEVISSSITDIVTTSNSLCQLSHNQNVEDQKRIQAAVFYSITSTQKGLRGIELGNKLIKKVVGEILNEFPHVSTFSSLSPIPGFREWLLIEISKAKEGTSILRTFFSNLEYSALVIKNDDFWNSLSNLLASNRWFIDPQLNESLKIPLLKSCVHYLFYEKRRSYALNSVAHFHLQNGAVLWRLNWAADFSPRGLNNSCGIMVNYRYFMDETENNSQKYIHENVIKISDGVKELLS